MLLGPNTASASIAAIASSYAPVRSPSVSMRTDRTRRYQATKVALADVRLASLTRCNADQAPGWSPR